MGNNALMRIVLGLVVAFVLTTSLPASAQECRVVEFDMLPAEDLQIVVWLEDDQGNFIETIFITRLTGTLGIGNRPGMMTFNSAWRWPYGRRTTTFPVWAHRHGLEWPQLEFQNADDTNLSHPLNHSSNEAFYCRPLREGEAMWDTQSCASIVYTDKGVLSSTETSLYPPRADHAMVAGVDDVSVMMFDEMNPFDMVSRATPTGSEPFRLSWPIPGGLDDGDYVAYIEVNKEFDQNAFYDYPEPVGIPWSEYGNAYRGQPSVVYRVPVTITSMQTSNSAAAYVGYGDPEGLTGMLFEPDNTITTDTPGSGASRLMLVDDGGEMYRVKVSARPTFDVSVPGAAMDMGVLDVTTTEMTVVFVAPGDDGMEGTATRYDIRILAGEPLTEDNWDDALDIGVDVQPAAAGTVQTIVIGDLLPRTNYYLGIRAYDECMNEGDLSVLHVLTPQVEAGEVDACFIATAAYGSMFQEEVALLRGFRDKYLKRSALGEILVEGYYTVGPALARLIAPSEIARRTARAGIGILVDAVRELAEEEAQRN